MTAILALALVVAGLAVVVGARETAKKIGLAVLAIIVCMSVGRCILCCLSAASAPSVGSAPGVGWFWPSIALALMAIGGIAWKVRAARQSRLNERRRRHMHPRQPAPLPPPSHSSDRGEEPF
jgi:hypothetical protein